MRTVDPEKHAARRAGILAAAAEVFASRGYDGSTTAAICERAGVGSGTLFHYFDGKRAIFLAIVQDDLAAVTSGLALVPAEPLAGLRHVLDLLTLDLGNPIAPGLAAAMVQLAQRDPEFAGTLVEQDLRVRTVLARVITAGQTSGVFTAAVDPARAARWIVALVDGGFLHSDDEDFDRDVDGAELRRIVASYLGSRSG